ncbi:MAG: FAD-dependent oxidoreductase [Comamonadaceae bacterium]|nr:MAG: FAD-dependent oxidoreductase [Comamonadaceae bacterium]
MRVAVIGAGWAGCAAAVEAVRRGHEVTLYESARTPGGRARRVESVLPAENPAPVTLDNGQHILIGAYAETLRLMAELGVDEKTALLRLPLTLRFPDGSGIRFPMHAWLPAPLDALVGIATAHGWTWRDRLSMLRAATGWQLRGFRCAPQTPVADLCSGLSAGAMAQLIEPLCVSALNTPPDRASGQVFLRVLRDALFSASGGSNLLLPRKDLGALLPDAALAWLSTHGGAVRLGLRVQSIARDQHAAAGTGAWSVSTDTDPRSPLRFGAVLLACPPGEAARLAVPAASTDDDPVQTWASLARSLKHEAITTVYALAPGARLAQPMLALRSGANYPAQFVFDRGQLGGPDGLLAFVVSASHGDSATLASQVLAQAGEQLGLMQLEAVQTIVEKRATFACTPGLQRPGMEITDGLLACGDYIEGPYPATLEGAVMSGLAAAKALTPKKP